jgi:succinate dehydrogenase / fumarate reductase membrane anchor subunit
MDQSSHLRSPIKRARGLGAAHSGTGHFWLQRLSALALVPLCIWFVVVLMAKLIHADAAGLSQWLHQPLVALAMLGLVVALFTHARLGVQTIIEDYLHSHTKKLIALLILNGLTLVLGAASLMAIFHLHTVTL